MIHQTDNTRIEDIKSVDSPQQVSQEFPITEDAAILVEQTRKQIHEILNQEDDRLLVIVGPCSIHDPKAAVEYAKQLLNFKREHANELLVVMRVYFEKPRTRVGWKGFINDPQLDNSFDINAGVRIARQLLLELNNMGLPAGTEFLDIVTGQYISDLISWGAIGARTTESQIHRELASGLSCPVGFKNGTDGNLTIACDAMFAAAEPHIFLSPAKTGNTAIFKTRGNTDTHIILRGGNQPNYDKTSIHNAETKLVDNNLKPRIMVDFSHANSQKQYKLQLSVADDVSAQIAKGNKNIMGVMIESHLVEGNQKIDNIDKLTYGQSITDACIGMEDTNQILTELASAVKQRREF